MRDCLQANPSKPQSSLWRVLSLAQSSFANRRRRPPHGQPSPPCSSLFKNLPEARFQKAAHRSSRPQMVFAQCLARTPEHASTQRCRYLLAQTGAFGALVSFIEVPQSIEVPLLRNLPLFQAFSPPFFSLQENQHLSCTSGFTARCHLRPSLPREPQMTTHTPFPGEHYR